MSKLIWGRQINAVVGLEYTVTLQEGQNLCLSIYGAYVNVHISHDGISITDYIHYKYHSSIFISLAANKSGDYTFILNGEANSAFLTAIIYGYDKNITTRYNRRNASAYAKEWAAYPGNPKFSSNMFAELGGDCTNFVSQAVNAGGIPMQHGDRNSPSSWFYYGSAPSQRSASWTSASEFTRHFSTGIDGIGYRRASRSRALTLYYAIAMFDEVFGFLDVGDAVQLTNIQDTSRRHSMIITDKGRIGGKDVLLFAQHSAEDRDRWFSGHDLYQQLKLNSLYGQGNEFIMLIHI